MPGANHGGRPETFDFLGFTHCCGTNQQGKSDSVGLLSMFDDVRDKTSAAKEWDRLINLPAEGPRVPASGPHPRTGDTTGAAISPRYKSPCHPPTR